MTLLDRIQAMPWRRYRQPEGNEPNTVPTALFAIWHAADSKSSSTAYHQFLYAVGNNHAGTYCPVLLEAVPFLAEISRTAADGRSAQRSAC